MASKPTLSVVIPAYNVQDYVGDALLSLKNQTELPDEVIVIDDGSTDNTLNIVEAIYLPCVFKVKTIENGGQGPARNLGVDISTSEYVYFFDADDLLAPEFVATIKERLERNDSPDMLLFSGASFDDDNYRTAARNISYERDFEGVFLGPLPLINHASTRSGWVCSPCLYVSKRKLWGRNNLRFASDYFEDNGLFYPLLFSCRHIVVIRDCLFFRRNRAGSTMTMEPNEKHVSGALTCLRTTITLHSQLENLPDERICVSRKVEEFSLLYVRYCRRLGKKVAVKPIYEAIKTTRSPAHFARLVMYITGLKDSLVIKTLIDNLRVVRRFCLGVRDELK